MLRRPRMATAAAAARTAAETPRAVAVAMLDVPTDLPTLTAWAAIDRARLFLPPHLEHLPDADLAWIIAGLTSVQVDREHRNAWADSSTFRLHGILTGIGQGIIRRRTREGF